MALPNHIEKLFAPLLPPLAYAARDGFACLHTLKGLEPLVQGVAQRAKVAGAPASLVEALLLHSRGFDAAAEPVRRTALAHLVWELGQVLSLPQELKAVARANGEAPAAGKAQLTLPSAALAAGASLSEPVLMKRPVESPPAGVELPPVAPAKAARKPRKKAAATEGIAGDAPKAPKAPPKKRKKAGEVAAEEEAEYATPRGPTGLLATPLKEAARIHGHLAGVLKTKRLTNVSEALFFFPRTYEDRRTVTPINRLHNGQRGVIVGKVVNVGEAPIGHRKVFRVVVADGTGSIAATWFHYSPWMRKKYEVGQKLALSGEVRTFGVREITHPETAPAEDLAADRVNFGRIVPIYVGFERGEQRSFRNLLSAVVEKYASAVHDPLPPALLERIKLPSLSAAVREIHFPENVDLQQLAAHKAPAQRRLAFDELFFIQLGMALRRKGVKLTPGIQFAVDEALLARSATRLPFALTNAQRRVLKEISSDMAKVEPMNRLLQGDVGSGKTAVALVSALTAIESGYQVALMAPTEILAEQHFRNFSKWLAAAGKKAVLLSAGLTKKVKDASKEAIASGEASLAIGTHAVLQGDVTFSKLGLVIIDEQHRFGVLQRATLMAKGLRPDVLVMTATPIPRTLAMTLYGDLELSVIDELPPGRTPIFTRVFHDRDRRKVYTLVGSELQKGRQAYVVYPLVDESEKIDLASATEGATELAAVFPDHKVGLLHGRMKGEEKDLVMSAFRAGEIQVLVSTTVIEVGVDVPNSTIMVVESADRFGLSQLHQLRGRVGRGTEKSYCYLIGGQSRNEEAVQRLAVMEKTTDGFEIAEEDLKIRGPGEFLGTRQSGVPGLSVADLARDQDLLLIAKEEALRIAEEDPRLEKPEHQLLREALEERWEGKLGLARVG